MSRVIALPSPNLHRPRRKRWIECADARHATENLPDGPGDVVRTLCRKSVAIVSPAPGMYAPECPLCDWQWRADEGIPQRAEHPPNQRSIQRSGRGRRS